MAKLKIKYGLFELDYEGNTSYMVNHIPKLISTLIASSDQIPSTLKSENESASINLSNADIGTLAKFMNDRNISSQNDRFLTTALWITLKDCKSRLKTVDVTTALRINQQKKLGNASDCLNQNISKGYCEKDGSEFYITQEGKKYLEINE
ncbi:MAG TPA: hypothetical protein VMW28_06230 [Pelolinea sp.]|nr:hypothetical protein [Pelolinea sp.]